MFSLENREILYEDETFKSRELAALVAAKVYYHLDRLDEAMSFALGAGSLFDVSQKTEFVDTLVGEYPIYYWKLTNITAKCIDEYIRLRTEIAESPDGYKITIDDRLERIVADMFDRCFRDKKWRQVHQLQFFPQRDSLQRHWASPWKLVVWTKSSKPLPDQTTCLAC